MSTDKFLTPVQALELALRVAGTYHPPECHSVVPDRNCDPILMPLTPCPHTDEQITAEWRAAIQAAGMLSLAYLFASPIPVTVPEEWLDELARLQRSEDPDFVLPWNEDPQAESR